MTRGERRVEHDEVGATTAASTRRLDHPCSTARPSWSNLGAARMDPPLDPSAYTELAADSRIEVSSAPSIVGLASFLGIVAFKALDYFRVAPMSVRAYERPATNALFVVALVCYVTHYKRRQQALARQFRCVRPLESGVWHPAALDAPHLAPARLVLVLGMWGVGLVGICAAIQIYGVRTYFDGRLSIALTALCGLTYVVFDAPVRNAGRAITALAANLVMLCDGRRGRLIVRIGLVMLGLAATWRLGVRAWATFSAAFAGVDPDTSVVTMVVRFGPSAGGFAAFVVAAYATVLGARGLWMTSPVRWARVVHPRPLAADWKLAHLSDLHLTDPGERTLEGHESPNASLRALFTEHAKALMECEGILVSGDITDYGSPRQWAEFFAALEQAEPTILERMVILPGNHDINILGGMSWLTAEPSGNPLRKARLVRMIAAMDRLQGDRTFVVSFSGEVVTLSELLRSLRRPLRDALTLKWSTSVLVLDDDTMLDYFTLVEDLWNQLFPMAVCFGLADRAPCCFVLDSTAPANNIFTNAFGRIAEGTPRRIDVLLADPRLADRPRIMALHHHVTAVRSGMREPIGWLKARFMVVANTEVAEAVNERLGHCPIFHGHRHCGFSIASETASLGPIVSAASTTLGDEVASSESFGSAGFMVWRVLQPADGPQQVDKVKLCALERPEGCDG